MNLQNLLLSTILLAPIAPEKPNVERAFLGALERKVAEKQTEWLLERKADWGNHVLRVWKIRESLKQETEVDQGSEKKGQEPSRPQPEVLVQVFAYRTAEEASKELRKSIALLSAPFSGSIKDLGDEAYAWANYGPGGESTIRLRRGSSVFYLSGPTLEITNGFAVAIVEGADEYAKRGPDPRVEK